MAVTVPKAFIFKPGRTVHPGENPPIRDARHIKGKTIKISYRNSEELDEMVKWAESACLGQVMFSPVLFLGMPNEITFEDEKDIATFVLRWGEGRDFHR